MAVRKRDHLLSVAQRMFCEIGFHAVSVDQILEKAGVARMTLYKNFGSKEDLIVAALKREDIVFRQWLASAVEARSKHSQDRILGIFSALHDRFTSDGYYGCSFIRASIEFPATDHPVHRAAQAHKEMIRSYLRGLAAGVEGADPVMLSEQLYLLFEGAITASQLHGEPWPAEYARKAAEKLLDASSIKLHSSAKGSKVHREHLEMVTTGTGRNGAEEALRESEEQFRSVFRDAGIGMVIVSRDGRFLAANPAFCECLGYTEEEILAKTVQSVTFHEDWPAFSQKLTQALEQGSGFKRCEKRCLHKNGRLVYTESSASLIRDNQGAPQYFVGEVLDVTQRKESEAALLSFNQRLIQTQEQERIRIARELHDDISQRVVMLGIELYQLEQASANLSGDLSNQITKMRKEALELSGDIQHLSHELHSASLEMLGFQAAIRSWCNEFSEKHKLEIQFDSQDIPSSLPAELSLTLYRVLQEALNNAARHSGVKHFDVRLWGSPNEIHLTVSDPGVGFDPDVFVSGRGLGLKSMRERLKLVHGDLAIESRPKGGTTIYARVPLTSSAHSALKTATGTAG